jgi:hypothetical protein
MSAQPSEAPSLLTGSEHCRCEVRHPDWARLRCTHREGHPGTHRNGAHEWANIAPAETLQHRQQSAAVQAAEHFLDSELTVEQRRLVQVVVDAVQAVR